MNDRSDIAAALQTLLASLSAQGERHLVEVQADLRQTRYLLAAAIGKLGPSFIGMHEAMVAQQALLGTGSAAGEDRRTEARRQELARLQAQARSHADAAMTALQFEDMTAQLIGRIVGHVDSLQAVLGAVGAGAQALVRAAEAGAVASAANTSSAGGRPDAAAAAVLASLNRLLADQADAAPTVAGKSVAQTHMDSGDIELF